MHRTRPKSPWPHYFSRAGADKPFHAWGSNDCTPWNNLTLPFITLNLQFTLSEFAPSPRAIFLNIVTFISVPSLRMFCVWVLICEWAWEAKTLLKDMYHINHVSVHTGINWVEGSLENEVSILLIQLEVSRWVSLLINGIHSLQPISYKMQKIVIRTNSGVMF